MDSLRLRKKLIVASDWFISRNSPTSYVTGAKARENARGQVVICSGFESDSFSRLRQFCLANHKAQKRAK